MDIVNKLRGNSQPLMGIIPLCNDAADEIERLRFALENCRLFAARHRKEDWALLILGFCAEGGVVGSITRSENQNLLAAIDATKNAEDTAVAANVDYCGEIERLREHVEQLTAKNQNLFNALMESTTAKDELHAKIKSARGHMNLYRLFSCEGSDSYDHECAEKNLDKVQEILK